MFNKLTTKLNNLENKISDTSSLIQANQYIMHQQNLEKKYLRY